MPPPRALLRLARRAALAAALALPCAAAAQAPAPTPGAADGAPADAFAAEGRYLRVMLMTMGPGDAVWERFGHNAIWVEDARVGATTYNYGMFDFGKEDFLSNFIRGKMEYWMQGFDAYATLNHYRGQNRDVHLQELALTDRQKVELRDYLVRNELPEHRFYRYDYYRDNCSTRVRDALDRVLGGRLKAATDTVATGTTYRSHTELLTVDDLATYTGLMVGLSSPSDRPLTQWEETFLPLKLRERVAELRVPDAAGRPAPLVLLERTVPSVGRTPQRTEIPNLVPGYLAAGAALGALMAALAARARRSAAARFGFGLLSASWLIFAASGGVVLAGLWALTDHEIAYANENLLQLSPLALPLVLLLPALGYGARWAARWSVRLAVAVAALSALGFVLQALPGVDQRNGMVIALALPVNAALAWAALRLRREATAPSIVGTR
jgi:hypothetical protein